MDYKCVTVSWLFRSDLSNLNAGEGGSNLSEIKTYRNGLPYISGQSVRHALRKAIQREHPRAYRCTVEAPCGNIKDCWLCDIFGYLLPGEGAKRWSPIKVSPALGQIRNSITTDMILRLVQDIECPHCHEKINPYWGRGEGEKEVKAGTSLQCPKCKGKFEAPYAVRQALAYKQLVENIYRVSIAIDVNALGIEEVPIIKSSGKTYTMDGIKYNDRYGDASSEERLERVSSILTGIANLSDFANQSRTLTSASPDVILISLQKQYNQRLSSALRMNEEGIINPEFLDGVIKDCLLVPGTEIYAAFLPGIISNEDDIRGILKKNPAKVHISDSPRAAIQEAIKKLAAV